MWLCRFHNRHVRFLNNIIHPGFQELHCLWCSDSLYLFCYLYSSCVVFATGPGGSRHVALPFPGPAGMRPSFATAIATLPTPTSIKYSTILTTSTCHHITTLPPAFTAPAAKRRLKPLESGKFTFCLFLKLHWHLFQTPQTQFSSRQLQQTHMLRNSMWRSWREKGWKKSQTRKGQQAQRQWLKHVVFALDGILVGIIAPFKKLVKAEINTK